MRESLTILAIALVLALTAALVGPYFYDWNQARTLIETRLSRAVGTPIKIAGDIDVKLLPTPYLVANDVRNVPKAPNDVAFAAKSMRFELATMPLLGGDLHFTEASFDTPQFTFFKTGDSFVWPSLPKSTPATVRFETVSVANGSLTLKDAKTGQSQSISSLNFTASASSLDGPFKADGTLKFGEEKTPFHLSSAVADAKGLRLKLSLDGSYALAKTSIDGLLKLSGPPQLQGTLTSEAKLHLGSGDVPVLASGPVLVTPEKAVSDAIELKIGDAEHPLKFSGAGEFNLARPGLQLTLAGGTFDLDAMLSPQGETAVPLAALQKAQSLFLEWQNAPAKLPLQLDVKAESLVIGGESITGLHVGVEDTAQYVPALHLEASGPFASQIKIDGTLFGPGNFVGSLAASGKDAASLAQWLSQSDPPELLFKSFSLQGPITWDKSLVAKDMDAKLDRSTLHGDLSYQPKTADHPAQIAAALTSEALDLDSVPDLSNLKPIFADADIAAFLEARTVKFARIGQGQLEAGHISLDFARTSGDVKVNHLKLDNIGGANLDLSGGATKTGISLRGHADAEKLDEMAKLLARLFPGPVTQTLLRRAALLAPLHLDGTGDAKGGDWKDWLGWQNLALTGTLGTSQINLQHHNDGTIRTTSGKLKSDDVARAFAQLGLPSLPLALGKADLDVQMSGKVGAPAQGKLTASMAGTELTFAPQLNPDFSIASGAFTLKSTDAAPFLQALSILLPDFQTRLPLDLIGRATLDAEHLQLQPLSGIVATTKLSGDLTLDLAHDAALSGTLAADHLDMQSIFALLLGAPQEPNPGSLWPESKFLSGMAQMPPAKLNISAKTLSLWPAFAASDAKFHLDLANDRLNVEHVQLGFDGAALEGDMSLRRVGSNVSLNLQSKFNHLNLASSLLSGKASGQLAAAGTGSSWAQLVASLGGTGTATIAGGSFKTSGAEALDSTVAAVERDEVKADATTLEFALSKELDKSARIIAEDPMPLALSNGQLTIGPGKLLAAKPVDKPAKPADLWSGGFDFSTAQFRANTSLTLATLPKAWSGEAPAIGLNWLGSFANPRRQIDASALANTLATRAIERSQAKIDALDADIRERAMFMRRMKALQFLDLRQKQEEDARRKALEDETRKKTEDEIRKKLEEDARKKLESAAPALPQSSIHAPDPAPLQLVPLQVPNN